MHRIFIGLALLVAIIMSPSPGTAAEAVARHAALPAANASVVESIRVAADTTDCVTCDVMIDFDDCYDEGPLNLRMCYSWISRGEPCLMPGSDLDCWRCDSFIGYVNSCDDISDWVQDGYMWVEVPPAACELEDLDHCGDSEFAAEAGVVVEHALADHDYDRIAEQMDRRDLAVELSHDGVLLTRGCYGEVVWQVTLSVDQAASLRTILYSPRVMLQLETDKRFGSLSHWEVSSEEVQKASDG